MDCSGDPFLRALATHNGACRGFPGFGMLCKQMHLKEELCRPHLCKSMMRYYEKKQNLPLNWEDSGKDMEGNILFLKG